MASVSIRCKPLISCRFHEPPRFSSRLASALQGERQLVWWLDGSTSVKPNPVPRVQHACALFLHGHIPEKGSVLQAHFSRERSDRF